MKHKAQLLGLVAIVAAAAGAWYLFLVPGGRRGADPNDAAQVALGRRVYAENCSACHGAKLEGQPGWRRRLPDGGLRPPPHDETGHTWHHPDVQLFATTKLGGQAVAPPGFRSNMPAFGGQLSDEEIWAVLAYIKSRWPRAIRERQATINARAERMRRR